MQWLRLYHDTITDPKWRVVANESEQTVATVLAVWMAMLCNASASNERGTLENWNDRIMGAALGVRSDAVAAVRAAMQGMVLDGDRLTGWVKRQREADDSATRTANYRKRIHATTGRKSAPYVAAEIIALDGGACVYCGGTEKLCVDHMVPVVCGGDHEQDNLACACRRCNSGKAGRTPEQARYEIRNAAAKARYLHAVARLGVNPITVKPIKTGDQQQPLTDTPCDDVTVTGADVTVTESHVTVTEAENPLTLTLLPTPTLTKDDDETARARLVAARVAELAMMDARRIRVAMVEAWLAADCDPEQDIYPAVRHCVGGATAPISSGWYFDAEVRRFHDRRAAPQPDSSNVSYLHRASGGRRSDGMSGAGSDLVKAFNGGSIEIGGFS